MNIKKALICLSIAAVLTLSVPNAAAASANKQTTNVHSSYATGASDKERPVIALLLGKNTTAVNAPVNIGGALATDEQGALHYIGGATITIQQLNYNGTEWNKLGTLQTSTDKDAGIFVGNITPKDRGYHIYRATYDGGSNYAPAVSNVVALIVN